MYVLINERLKLVTTCETSHGALHFSLFIKLVFSNIYKVCQGYQITVEKNSVKSRKNLHRTLLYK